MALRAFLSEKPSRGIYGEPLQRPCNRIIPPNLSRETFRGPSFGLTVCDMDLAVCEAPGFQSGPGADCYEADAGGRGYVAIIKSQRDHMRPELRD
jgi:hypothetical protein